MDENSFNLKEGQKMRRKSSSFYDINELKKETNELRNKDFAEAELKNKLMFEEKDISIFFFIDIYLSL